MKLKGRYRSLPFIKWGKHMSEVNGLNLAAESNETRGMDHGWNRSFCSAVPQAVGIEIGPNPFPVFHRCSRWQGSGGERVSITKAG